MDLKKLLFPFSLIFSLVIVNHSFIYSQNGTVRGFVYESETGEPVIFTNVYFYKTSIGAATDINGYFAITKVPPGDYDLMVTYLGFDTLKIPLTIKANDLITKKLYLTKSKNTPPKFIKTNGCGSWSTTGWRCA